VWLQWWALLRVLPGHTDNTLKGLQLQHVLTNNLDGHTAQHGTAQHTHPGGGAVWRGQDNQNRGLEFVCQGCNGCVASW